MEGIEGSDGDGRAVEVEQGLRGVGYKTYIGNGRQIHAVLSIGRRLSTTGHPSIECRCRA